MVHHHFHLPLVESLVGRDGHHDLVADPQEEKTTLRQVQRDLTDDLVKTLGEELFSDGANTAFAGLPLHQLLIEHLSEACHIDSGGWLVAHILYPVLTCVQIDGAR